MSGHILAFKPTMLGTHDFSACLMTDGTLVAAAEEERFRRVKHATRMFPSQAIKYCLEEGGIAFQDLTAIGIPYDPALLQRNFYDYYSSILKSPGLLARYERMGHAINKLTFRWFGRDRIRLLLSNSLCCNRKIPIYYFSHHLCHAASAYFCQHNDPVLIITADGKGEFDSTVIWRGQNGFLTRLVTFVIPNSLGLAYSLFTEFLGFERLDGEGKVMGLAPYGHDNPQLFRRLGSIVRLDTRGYDVRRLVQLGTPRKLAAFLNIPPRLKSDTILDVHKDLAWYIQDYVERAMVGMVSQAHQRTGIRHVAMAGGVALNCSANKKIRELPFVDSLFVQPAASDAGLALGCAQLLSQQFGYNPFISFEHCYWGPGFSDAKIETLLQRWKLPFRKSEDPSLVAARLLAQGKMLGWFQGRMELGPRALGNRSILAHPGVPGIREQLNREVKQRENWRPFAPSVLQECASKWFVNCNEAPFMTTAFDTYPQSQARIAGALHPVDQTARVQTVTHSTNERFYRLIKILEEFTGVPVVLNTSFNLAGEPIVCSPEQAVVDFYRSGLDALIIGNCILMKENNLEYGESAVRPSALTNETKVAPATIRWG